MSDFRDGFFPFDGTKIKEFLEGLKRVSPDLILTHRRDDAHQDHRQIADLTWNTFEIISFWSTRFRNTMATWEPSVFVPLATRKFARQKSATFWRPLSLSAKNAGFREETFLSLMRLQRNGMQRSQWLRRSFLLPQASRLSCGTHFEIPQGIM